MLREIGLFNNQIKFAAKQDNSKNQESRILPNTISTRINQKYDKTTSAILEYSAKGLTGDVNSDFYEFLSMGIIPYITGSAVFMGLFNLVNNHLLPKSSAIAASKGKKMALGVVLFGLCKTLANELVTRPVSAATGVDIELPYLNVYYPLPTKPGAEAEIIPQHQQRKVYDSREFFRKDLLEKDPNYGKAYYDKIAKKIGLGGDLNDSVTETTPIIQSIVSMTKTAKVLSSYAWAAAGVGLAMQGCWDDFFTAVSNRKKYSPKANDGFFTKVGSRLSNFCINTYNLSKSFIETFFKSVKNMWSGDAGTKGFMKHMGKAWLIFASLLTVGSVANVIYRAKQMGKLANKELIDKNQESTVI